MSKVTVLGSGRVGSAIALDMADRHEVHLIDIDRHALEKVRYKKPDIEIHELDIRRKSDLLSAIEPVDAVISAVPGFMGYKTLENVIEAGKPVVDISFSPENLFDLDEQAKSQNITAVIDCGVAPGLDNILLGNCDCSLDVDMFECLVGGLPASRKWPFFYKAPFSPLDVLEEYTRPARMVEFGRIVTKPALSEPEYKTFNKVGTLEAFNTDGLRTLLHTMEHIPNMKEKTLRYPGHLTYIKALKAAGFFDEKPVSVKDNSIKPIDFTAGILFKEWELKPGEKEFTVMRVTVKGLKDGQSITHVYDLYDEYDEKNDITSMARTTGYTATAVANLLLDGLYEQKGIIAPEFLGQNKECFEYIMQYLNRRSIHININKVASQS